MSIKPVELNREEDVYILTMHDGENRLNRDFIDAINAALDEVEHSSGPAVLVTTGAGKFYSNGLDLDWMAGDGSDEMPEFLDDVDRLYARMLTFPMATAVAINGHAFGGGAMIALAHDYRVMRDDKGFFCFPEIDLGMSFTPMMNAILMARFDDNLFRNVVLTGAHIGGKEAKKLGIVDDAVMESELISRAIACVAPLAGKDKTTMGSIKRMRYKSVLNVLNILSDK